MQVGPPEPRKSYFARISIGLKLPLITAGLVLVVGGALTTAAYVAFRNTLNEVAIARVDEVGQRLVTGYKIKTTRELSAITAASQVPALTDYLINPSAANSEKAAAALTAAFEVKPVPLRLELRDLTGAIVMSTDSAPVELVAERAPESLPALNGATAAIGVLRALNDSLIYPVLAPVGNPLRGYLVEWRLISTSERTREAVASVMGTSAAFHLGNRDGSIWTDLASIGPGPVIAADTVMTLKEYHRGGRYGDVMGAVIALPQTPWVLAFEFPKLAVFESVDDFLRRLMVIAALCLSLGVIAAWWFSRQITVPLHRLTLDSHRLASGRGEPLPIKGDELQQLRASFDRMAQEVTESRHRLEDKVSLRTHELHEALGRLEAAQETLIRREKLALLGQLSSSIGHELRNPLGVMSNAIYYLQTVQEAAPDDVKRYLNLLKQQVSLSTKIVSDLLDFSRGSQPERQATDLGAKVHEQWERLAPPAHLTLEAIIPAEFPPVYSDPVHLDQILVNLYTNAIQSMNGAPGSIRVVAKAEGSTVRLEVRDCGAGIPNGDHEKVFEPLYSTKPRGIGLGLAVSRSLAQANGGELYADSAAKDGATFVLVLPVGPGT
jgi:signal transduction histidine kinase